MGITLVHNPEILILDEPTVGIDPLLRCAFWDEFAKRSAAEVTIIITTHFMDGVYHCTKLGLIRNGEMLMYETPSEIMIEESMDSIEEAFLKLSGGDSK